MFRVTADTNILISGLNFFGGKPEAMLTRKFAFTPEDIAEARTRIRAMARTVKPAVLIEVVKEDPPDNRILECAVAAGSDYLVTGDKDLLRLGSYDSIRILNVSDFLDLAQTREP